jgi:hypothetical protein
MQPNPGVSYIYLLSAYNLILQKIIVYQKKIII